MVDYDEFQAEVLKLKRERWLAILAAEPPGRVPGRRPRDAEQERMLTRMDRARLARCAAIATTKAGRSDASR